MDEAIDRESFFGTLKSEFFHINKFAGIEQLQQGLHRYIHYLIQINYHFYLCTRHQASF